MKATSLRLQILAITLASSALLGCASMAVSGDAIEQNTATSLKLQKGTFTISDRANDGLKSSYTVTTNDGKKYACYVTGTIAITGRVVSDAVCSEMAPAAKKTAGASPAPTAQTPTTPPCNALLKAAGKCS